MCTEKSTPTPCSVGCAASSGKSAFPTPQPHSTSTDVCPAAAFVVITWSAQRGQSWSVSVGELGGCTKCRAVNVAAAGPATNLWELAVEPVPIFEKVDRVGAIEQIPVPRRILLKLIPPVGGARGAQPRLLRARRSCGGAIGGPHWRWIGRQRAGGRQARCWCSPGFIDAPWRERGPRHPHSALCASGAEPNRPLPHCVHRHTHDSAWDPR